MLSTYELWRPKGIEDLELRAWDALRCTSSACIVAGPGAGKTEFLAQKAAFLLETAQCYFPYRILAISFKKDAAENLAARVKKRCRLDHAARFDSLTFDAFTKGLVDRFRLALPESWRLPEQYEITNFNDRDYHSFLMDVRDNNPKQHYQIAAIRADDFKKRILPNHKISNNPPATLEEALAKHWFEQQISKNLIDFLLLNRLAEWITRLAPTVQKAIRQTYPFVFVDEFQDTTFSQYDFLHSLFYGSQANITAVGDDKQRIMTWAGARPDAFRLFASDYSATTFSLIMNYRSSPGLVAIQHHLSRSIEPDCIETQSGASQAISGDYAQIWNFPNHQQEYKQIAEWIAQDKEERRLEATNYAILVRQKPDDFYQEMVPIFNQYGLSLRNEAARFGKMAVQDIVHDDIFILISALLRLTIQKKSPSACSKVSDYLYLLHGDQANSHGKEDALGFLLKRLRLKLGNYAESEKIIDDILSEIFNFMGLENIQGVFPHYAIGENWSMFIESATKFLKFCAQNENSWSGFIRLVDGEGQIPLLTIHKSKGLEYDTIIFIGLDDTSWWSYSPDNLEGKATFFVAFSRAKQRVIFTYSKGRNGRNKVSELYELLSQAGIAEISFEQEDS